MKISDIFVGIFGSIVVHVFFFLLMLGEALNYMEYLFQVFIAPVF